MKFLLLCFALFGASSAQFSASAQADILSVHNTLRSQVAKGTFVAQGQTLPSAADMSRMQWSTQLASTAQTFANSCPSAPSGSDSYGESLFYAWSNTKPTSLDSYGKQAALSWQGEFQQWDFYNLYDENAMESGPGENVQMIWSTSYLVGCGVKNCGPDPQTYTKAYKIVVVCQYLDKGNNLDSNVYEEGPTGSDCQGFAAANKTTGLCP